MESIDTSNIVKVGDQLYELLDAFVEKIREENVIQVIMAVITNWLINCCRLKENVYIGHHVLCIA